MVKSYEDFLALKPRPLDVMFCTSGDLISCLIRLRESGKFLDQNIPTHCGFIYWNTARQNWYFASMIPRLRDYIPFIKHKSELRNQSIKDTFWIDGADTVIDIRRCSVYDDVFVQAKALLNLEQDLEKYLRYDFENFFKYILPFLKDCKNEYYCSEYVANRLERDGWQSNIGSDDDVDPYKLSTLLNLIGG